MASSLARARTLVATCIGVGSMGAGLVLAFRLVTPGSVDLLRTSELVGLIGLMVLPILTLWALASQQRSEPHAASAPAPRPSPSVIVEPKPLPVAATPRDEQHMPESRPVPGRRTPKHRRHEPAETRRASSPARHDVGSHH